MNPVRIDDVDATPTYESAVAELAEVRRILRDTAYARDDLRRENDRLREDRARALLAALVLTALLVVSVLWL